jgi:hypothetical protein
MIVWLAGLGAMVHMGQNAEAELGILIEDFPLWHLVAKMGGDKILVLEDISQERADFLPAFRAGLGLENPVTRRRELC